MDFELLSFHEQVSPLGRRRTRNVDLNFNNCGFLSMLKMEDVSLALAFIHWPLRIAINKAERQTSTWSGNLTLVIKSVFSYRSDHPQALI